MNEAEAYGIDLRELEEERPDHPKQLRIARAWNRKAEQYWLAQVGKIPPSDDWVSAHVAAEFFTYSMATIYKWARAGVIRAKKENYGWLIDFADLEAFIRDRK